VKVTALGGLLGAGAYVFDVVVDVAMARVAQQTKAISNRTATRMRLISSSSS
jgi:hypothetical protein